MTFRRSGSSYILRLFKGEELVSTLKAFIQKYGITAGTISGIGATDLAIIGYYDESAKNYNKRTYEGNLEILNLTGNISMLNGEPFLHLHIILGDSELNTAGGHLFEAKISVTGEIFINAMDTILHRESDAESGLNLLKL